MSEQQDAPVSQPTVEGTGDVASPPATTPGHTSLVPTTGASLPVPAVQRRLGKVRSPFGGWLLAIVTLGFYPLFWYYNLNRELRDYDRSISVSPGLAVLSLFVPILGLVSIYNTGGRIRHAQNLAGVAPTASGGVGFLLTFLFGLYLPYYSAQANMIWISPNN